MTDRNPASLPKWPFLIGDLLLLGTAYLILSRSELPLSVWHAALLAATVLAGAIVMIIPFRMEYQAASKLDQAASLETALAKLNRIEAVAAQISGATQQWDQVQTNAGQAVKASKEISDRMMSELKSFSEFVHKANDTEKGTLKLEVEKLRRTESEWLQTCVRILDHVYALYVAAMRSGQKNVIEQVGNFQGACIDVTRRLGLTPFIGKPGEAFNPERHQSLEETVPENAQVEATMATGYTFQGRVLRPALVKVRAPGEAAPAATEKPNPAAQSQLSLESDNSGQS